MSLFGFSKKNVSEPKGITYSDRGILVFENTSEVIRAENILKNKGSDIRVMGPPPEVRTGCDMVIEFALIEELNILRSLEESRIKPLQVIAVNSPLLQPVDLFNIKDFGQYLMVRAANMKLTIDKESKIIVNISGGGCPDIPYLASQMIDKHLDAAPSPKEIGHTLCGYALQLAFEEVRRICSL